MDATDFKKIVERAKNDSEFFHNLVFDTEKILKDTEIDRKTKIEIQRINPQQVIATIVGELSACGGSETCSCTSGTCGGTCGGSTCSVTCSGDSCGNTCGDSCGYTTNLEIEYEFAGFKNSNFNVFR